MGDTAFETGAAVRVLPNRVLVEPGTVGRVLFWSQTGHPVVLLPELGRRLIPARHLEPWSGDVPALVDPVHEPEGSRVPLGDTLPPRPATVVPEPPTVDWCEAPEVAAELGAGEPEVARGATAAPDPPRVPPVPVQRRLPAWQEPDPATLSPLQRAAAAIAAQRSRPRRQTIRAR